MYVNIQFLNIFTDVNYIDLKEKNDGIFNEDDLCQKAVKRVTFHKWDGLIFILH